MSTKKCGGNTPSQVGFGSKDCGCAPTEQCFSTNCYKQKMVNLEVEVWDDPGCDGDNVVRLYNTTQCVYKDGYFYWPLKDGVVDAPPSVDWTEGVTKCEMLRPVGANTPIGIDVEGADVLVGDCLVTCSTLDNALEDVALGTNISGDPLYIGGCFVGCDDFSDEFEVTNGKISLNTCGDAPESVGEVCKIIPVVYVQGADGCWSQKALEEGSNDLAEVGANVLPAGDTFDFPIAGEVQVTDYYTTATLQDDIAADTVDTAKLDKYKIQSMNIVLACDSRVMFNIRNTVKFEPETPAISRIVYSLNGDLAANATTGFPDSIALVTSFERDFNNSIYMDLPAGTHTIETYAVAEEDGRPMVSMTLANKPTNKVPRLTASVAVG